MAVTTCEPYPLSIRKPFKKTIEGVIVGVLCCLFARALHYFFGLQKYFDDSFFIVFYEYWGWGTATDVCS